MKATIFHEIGHIVGYILANKKPETSLGNYSLQLGLGQRDNRVIAHSCIYIIENTADNNSCNERYESTKNIRRTVAYFIKLLLGCTFQCIIQKSDFNVLWNVGENGETDMLNMHGLRSCYAFKWSYTKDIVPLQKELQELFTKENLTSSLNPLIERLEEEIDIQGTIIYEDARMEVLKNEIEGHLSQKLEIEYSKIVDKWTTIFKASPAGASVPRVSQIK